VSHTSGNTTYWDPTDETLVSNDSEIIDDVFKREELHKALKGHRGITRRKIRAKFADQIHPCDHTQTKYKYLDKGLQMLISYPWPLAGPDGIQTHVRTWNEGALVRERLTVPGFPYNKDSGTLRTSSTNYTGPDWFSLVNRFNEQCQRLMPAKSILGESIVEHGAFLLPFQLLLRPRKCLLDFLSRVRKIGRARHSLLGQLVETAKESASALLGFQFGISPAIDEVINIVSAHERVDKRMRYLREHAGAWIPIRVREVIPCEITDNGFSSPPYPGTFTVERKTTEKNRTCVISALGKVRDDIGQQEQWKYYLQTFGFDKILGLGWELIPFSFVVDWFTNFQERINNLSGNLLFDSPFTAFKRVCCSITDWESQTHYCLPNAQDSEFGMNTWDKPTKPFAFLETQTRRYQRLLEIPDTSGVVDLRNLGLFHLITGGSLVIQRLP
jgi:hypothetical protein